MTKQFSGRTGVVRAVLLASACGLAVSLAGQARAQESQDDIAQPAPDAPEQAGTGNEIIVTASKREQTLQDVPIAVSVTSAETIERTQIRDVRDLQTLIPSLRVTQSQALFATSYSIRGFGTSGNNAGFEPSVGVFVDGVYRSRSISQVSDLPDLQRIEVLRGPQSTLFGKNASAGVISIVTREPQYEFGGNLEASYGNFNAVVLKGVITGPLAENVAASIAGGYNHRDGFVTDLGYGGKTNGRNRWFVRGQLKFEPTSALKIRLIADYDKIDEVCCAAINLRRAIPGATQAIFALGGLVNDGTNPFADVTYSNFASTNKLENYGFSGQIDYDLGPLTLTSITAYRKSNSLTNQDSDFTSADLIGFNGTNIDLKTITQELRVATNLDGPLNFLLGGYYFNEKVYVSQDLRFGNQFRGYANFLSNGGVGIFEQLTGTPAGTFQAPGQGLAEDFRLKNDAYSVFGNIDFAVTDRLTLTLGANYTKDKKDVSTTSRQTDVFSAIPLSTFVGVGQAVLTNQFLATAVGQALQLPTGTLASAAQIQGFAGAQPAIFAQIQAQATGFGALNSTLTAAQAGADTNPLTVGNPFLDLTVLQFLPPFMNYPNAVESGKTRDGDWSYTARLAYEVSDTLNTYASYSTGFKASSFNLGLDSRPTPADRATLISRGLAVNNLTSGSRFAKPEDSELFEVGIKGNWGIASANLTVFKQSIKNFQTNVFVGTGFFLSSAEKQSTFGVEFDGMVKPVPELTLSMAMTFLEPKYDKYTNSVFGDVSGETIGNIPKLSATWGAQWDQPLANEDRIILRTDFHYESTIQVQPGLSMFITRDINGNPVSYTAARAIARPYRHDVNDLSASISYVMRNGLELSVWGRNLLDDRFVTDVFDSVAQTGSISGYLNQPRTYGVSARFKF
jgi:outer membrane receptor protein involved in Fe transport